MQDILTAQIKRPTKSDVPFFSDDDLKQLADWIKTNLTSGKSLQMFSVIEGEDEVLKVEII